MAERFPPVDLDLYAPARVGTGPVDLNLGDAPQPDATVTIAGALPALYGRVVAGHPVTVSAAASLPAIAAQASITYDNAVNRGPSLRVSSAWQPGAAAGRTLAAPWQRHTPARAQRAAAWRSGTPAGRTIRCPQATLSTGQRPQVAARFAAGTRAGARWLAGWRKLDTTQRPQRRAPWRAGTPAGTAAVLPWITLYTHARPRVVAPWGAGTAAGIARTAPHAVGTPAGIARTLPWGEGTDRYGWGAFVRFPEPPQPPEPPCYTPPVGVVDLDLRAALQVTPGPVLLALVCPQTYPPGTVVVPAQRSYIVVNTASLIRLSDGADIPCTGLALSIDADSWGWQFSARCPAAALPLLDGGPLRARINGVDWHVVVDSVSRTREFPAEQITLTGRGLAAELAAPLAVTTTRVSTAPRTAQQLAAEALPYDWTLDWQPDDWLVPAGAWSNRGTPIEAVLAIAGSIRAVVQAARASRTIAVLPRWPVAPWELPAATPDVVLPINPLTTLSESRSEAAALNAVYVSGTAQGIVARVKRAGTAGDVLAGQVSDALITATAAARARGLAELAAGGEQAEVEIELPLAPADSLPLLDVGQIVQVGESPAWNGIVRGVAVEWARPQATQRVTLERRWA